MKLSGYVPVLLSLRQEAAARSAEAELDSQLHRFYLSGGLIPSKASRPAKRMFSLIRSGSSPEQARRQALDQAHFPEPDQRPFGDQQIWPQDKLAQVTANYARMLANASDLVSRQLQQIADEAPAGTDAQPSGPGYDLDDSDTRRGRFAALLARAAALQDDPDWLIARCDELGQSPLSAVCDEQYESVLQALAARMAAWLN